MKLKRAQDRLEALKKTPVGAKALADVTAEVGACVQCMSRGGGGGKGRYIRTCRNSSWCYVVY